MHIDSIELFRVPLLPDEPAVESPAKYESAIALLRSGEHIGFGEATLATAPLESDQWSAGAFMCLCDWLAPAIVGRSIDSGEALQQALAPFCGNHAAKSALDVAWWSLAAVTRGKPLYQLLGALHATVPVSRTLGVMDSPHHLLAEINSALAGGYDHVTLKLRPGWDVEMLRAVRQRFPDAPIAVDCDGLCSLGQQEMFYRLEDFFLKYIEQPFAADDLVAHAMLQENLRTPLALDQSVTSPARVEQALDLGACRMVRINLKRVGGITPALAIRAACELAKIPTTVGGGPQSEVAASASAALAVRCGGALPDECYSWWKAPWLMSDSTTLMQDIAPGKLGIRLPDSIPGWGFRVDTEILADVALEQARLA